MEDEYSCKLTILAIDLKCPRYGCDSLDSIQAFSVKGCIHHHVRVPISPRPARILRKAPEVGFP